MGEKEGAKSMPMKGQEEGGGTVAGRREGMIVVG